jgi:hypothetical protein
VSLCCSVVYVGSSSVWGSSSVNGCRLIKLNYLNFSVLYDLLFYYYASLVTI